MLREVSIALAIALIFGTSWSPSLSCLSTAHASANDIGINVLSYGAKGDGTTDNRAALATAIGIARKTGQVLYFPSTGGRLPTVYKTSALAWAGVSMYGPPCGGEPTTGFSGCVVLESEPAQDIFASANPTERSYTAPLRSFVIRDLTFTVDDSRDVSKTLGAHRGLGVPVTRETCGNAALAIPIVNGKFATANPGPNIATFDHVIFNSSSLTPGGRNHSCGVYTNAFPHSTHWNSVIFSRLWAGYADTPPPTNQKAVDWASDDNLWSGDTFQSDYYPWIEYNSGGNLLQKWNVYCNHYGPIWLAFQAATRNANWHNEIETMDIDGDAGCIEGLWLGSGDDDVIINFAFGGQNTSPMILDTVESHFINFYAGADHNPAVAISGYRNDISMHGGSLPNLYTDTGSNNYICVNGVSNRKLTKKICEFGMGDGRAAIFNLNQMPVAAPRIYVNGKDVRPEPTIANGIVTFRVAPRAGAVLQEQP